MCISIRLNVGVGMEDTNVENQFVVLYMYIIYCYRLQSSHWMLIEIVYKKNIAGYFMDLYNLLYWL